MDDNQTQPQLFSLEAERAILGAVLTEPAEIENFDIDPEDFYLDRHRLVWGALTSIHRAGRRPDYVEVTELLHRRGHLAEIGGPAMLTELVASHVYGVSLDGAARIIRDYAFRRRALLAASDLARAAYNTQKPTAETIPAVMDRLACGLAPTNGARHWAETLSAVFDDTSERAQNPRDVWGVPTGFVDFDRATGGLQPGEVVYIGGEPGIGKSIWSMQAAVQMARSGYPGAIYSLEMRAGQIGRRALSALARVETRKIKTGRMDSAEWASFTVAYEQAAAYPLYLCDDASLTTQALRADLARLKARHGIRWFVLDYLFLMSDGEGRMDDNQRTAMLSRRIKAIAGDLGLSAVTVNSVTKEAMGDDARPGMKSIRGSGQVIHDADMIAILTQHIPGPFEAQNPKLRTFTFVKGRELEAGAGYFHLVKLDGYPGFGDYTGERVNLSQIGKGNGNGKK